MTKTLRAGLVCAVALLAPHMAQAAPKAPTPAVQWWADLSALADDANEGRAPGTPGYERAADYVIKRFKALGLKPAGVDGYRQPVAFEQQLVDLSASTAELTAPDGVTPLKLGVDAVIGSGGGPRPEAVDAPLVFIGYGLHMPDQGHDDLAGLDLKGKIAVVISGGPTDLPGTVKSQARFALVSTLAKRGAVGLISLVTPKQVEIPWDRRLLLAGQPGMYLVDASLRETPDGFFSASLDPARSELLFRGSGHSFDAVAALSDASAPVPTFDLAQHLKATISAHRTRLSSANLVAKLPGRDAKLKAEYVLISAHLDHLGVGAPINGDKIYNGAMDDASGVASVLGIAKRLSAVRPKRSVLFVVVTAEEKGLLGSWYYANRPTVPFSAIVADLNMDMPLPLWPLKGVVAQGAQESSLGAAAAEVAKAQGLALMPDPLPDRNSFIRTDQFSFVRKGVPSLAFKFGFAKGTPEFEVEHEWRAHRYHAPSDDLAQPGILKDEAVKLDAYIAGIARRVANAEGRPQWLPTSVFGKAKE
jgi:Zn-dependent M28 family amino/carboxypeptidase